MGDLLPDLAPARTGSSRARPPDGAEPAPPDLVAAHGQGRGAAQPRRRPARRGGRARVVLGPPGEVDVLRPHRLGVVVGQERRVLVAPVPRQLEPRGEARMKPRPSRLRQTSVGDVPGERVRDRELALADDRRARPVPHEIALLQQAKVRLDALEQLVDRTRPEGAADHRRRLQTRLLGRLEQVDPSGENGLHRVGHDEVARQLATRPVPASGLVRPLVDQRPQELLDEERVSLRSHGRRPRERTRELGRKQLVDQARRVSGGQRLQPERLGLAATPTPRRATVNELRSCGAEQQQRTADVLQRGFEQVEEGRPRPSAGPRRARRRVARRRAPPGSRPTPGAADPARPADGGRPAPPSRASGRGSRAGRADRARSRPNRSAAARNAPERCRRAACRRSPCPTRCSGRRAAAVRATASRAAARARGSASSSRPPRRPMIVTSRGCASSTTRP